MVVNVQFLGKTLIRGTWYMCLFWSDLAYWVQYRSSVQSKGLSESFFCEIQRKMGTNQYLIKESRILSSQWHGD